MAAPNFEKDLEKLESIVEALEEGGLSLDDSLKRFEEGITLTQRCEKTLAAAEKRIEVLTQKASGELEAVPFDEENPARLAQLCAQQLEDEIASESADTIAAFIMEPVLGSGGVIVPHSSFMPMVRDICDRHGILLIADEVITAFGRTGAWTGSRLWDVRPDMMCIAKAITNGYFPFGATMIGEALVDAFESNKDGAGEINHGYTYSGHPVGAAAALAMLEQLKTTDVAANAGARGKELGEGLAGLKEKHRWIGDARGIGLMHALELVSDTETKKALDKKSMAVVGEAIYEDGVMVRISGNNIILSPALILTDEHVQRIVDAIDAGLDALTR